MRSGRTALVAIFSLQLSVAALAQTFPEIEQPPDNPLTPSKIALGKTLFWDEQLSSTRTTACGTCHRGRAGGSDPRTAANPEASRNPGRDRLFGTEDDTFGSPGIPLSRADGSYQWSSQFGLREQVTRRKAQSVFNAAFGNKGPFGFDGILWDGRAQKELKDPITGETVFSENAFLESQALLPFMNTTEMGHIGRTWGEVTARVQTAKPLALATDLPRTLETWIADRSYPALFQEVFGTSDITPVRIAMAIASYERTLISDQSQADQARLGLVPDREAAGAALVEQAGCKSCHELPLASTGRFRGTGVRPIEEDAGQGEVPGLERRSGLFRTPSFRNATLRGALFHTGASRGLEEVLDFYNRGGNVKLPVDILALKPLNLSMEDMGAVVSFLRTFTDLRSVHEMEPFDRPLLYSESARRPQITAAGVAAPNGQVPIVTALEPPVSGNPAFTLGLSNISPGSRAVLVIDTKDPGTGPAPPSASFLRRELVVSDDDAGHGFASATFPISADPALIGLTLHGRWFVTAGNTLSVSPEVQFRIFAPRTVEANPLLSVSAATLLKGPVAPGSIATAFGSGLASSSVSIVDRTGTTFPATVLFAGENQINYIVPDGVSMGEARISVLRGGSIVSSGSIQVAAAAPGLFTANADGFGAAAGFVQFGHRAPQTLAQHVDGFPGLLTATIELPETTDEVSLILYGTGIRGHRSPVSATVAGLAAEVLYAGPQTEYSGLDQINLRLPQPFWRRGEVEVILNVDGAASNPVHVRLK